MPLLECRAIAFAHGIETVLDGVDLTLERGERTGLVGVNGSGKTTLCRIVLGELEAEGGELHLAAGTRVGYLSQDPRLDPDGSVRDEAMNVFADLGALHDRFAASNAALGDAAPGELQGRLDEQAHFLAELEHRGGFDYEQRMLSTLAALGFGMADLDRPVRQLSGGEKSRLALARLLESGCDVLLLDEPTNHLDIPMTEWLEGFLKGFAGAALIVSHDRWLLDNVCQTIVELEGGRATRYHFGEGDAKLPPLDDPDAPDDGAAGHYGAYTHFQRVKGERRAAEWKAYVGQRRELARQEEWIRWKLNLRRGSHVRAARSRQKMLDKQERTERPADDLPVVLLNFEPRARGPNDIATIRGCSYGFGGEPLFTGVEIFVRRLDRLGIVGPNGCGKTSLVRLLLGEAQPTGGICRLGDTAVVGYYHQEHEDLDLATTPLEAVRAVAPELSVPQIRGFLARFLFFGDDVFRRVESFSGGERSRLVLARLIAQRPNVLLLDEPTNHLDIPSREVLEEALRQFQGTILVVSHDRWFLERICRRLLVFEGGTAEVFEGPWSALEAGREAARAHLAAEAERDKRERFRAHQEREREAQRRKAERHRDGRSVAQVEARIEAAEAEVEALHGRFLDPELYRDGEQVKAVQQAEAELRAELEALYAEWEARLGG